MEPPGTLTYRKKSKKEKNLLYLSGRKKLSSKGKNFLYFPKRKQTNFRREV